MSDKSLSTPNITGLRLIVLLAASSLLALPTNGHAQSLRPKRTLTVSVAPGCEAAATRPTGTRRDNAEARRLAAAGQEAALQGDQTAARDAFAKAAELNPTDDRIAYDLGRAHEELVDTTGAINEYCRYLTLSPAGRESGDVRTRLQRLVPRNAAQNAADLLQKFRLGLFLYDSGRYDAAERAFDEVVQKAPLAAEGYFNRGLMRAAVGSRAEALKDFESYLAAVPAADDRTDVTRAITVLRRPVYGAGTALFRSIIPGFGQFYTDRPVIGVLALAGAAGAAGMAVLQTTSTKQIEYLDPNGVPAPYTQEYTERKYLVPGIAAAAGITLVAALEAVWYAKRSSRGATVLQSGRVATVSNALRDHDVALVPTLNRGAAPGLRLSARF